MLSDLKELRLPHVVFAAHLFVASIGPGFLILFRFRPGLFAQLGDARLLIFSAAITVPVIAWHAFCLQGKRKSGEHLDSVAAFIAACFFTSIHLYFALLVAYLTGTSFRTFFYVACGLEVIFLIGNRLFKTRG